MEKIVKNYSMSVSWRGDGKKVFVNAMRVTCICFNYKILKHLYELVYI